MWWISLWLLLRLRLWWANLRLLRAWYILIRRNIALLLPIIANILLPIRIPILNGIGISVLHRIRICNNLYWCYHWWCLRRIDKLLLLLLNDKLLFFEVPHNLTVYNASKDISIAQISCKVINVIAQTIPNLILVLMGSTDCKQDSVAEDCLRDCVRIQDFLRLLLFFFIEEVALPGLFEDQPHIFSDPLYEFAQVELLVLAVVEGGRED